jgi:hypothetical protein
LEQEEILGFYARLCSRTYKYSIFHFIRHSICKEEMDAQHKSNLLRVFFHIDMSNALQSDQHLQNNDQDSSTNPNTLMHYTLIIAFNKFGFLS